MKENEEVGLGRLLYVLLELFVVAVAVGATLPRSFQSPPRGFRYFQSRDARCPRGHALPIRHHAQTGLLQQK